MWNVNQARAAERNEVLHPVQFAKMIVDDNFADLVQPPALS
jgi:hypothetical protein